MELNTADNTTSDLKFILSIINIRNELSAALHKALKEMQGEEVKVISLPRKMIWMFTLLFLSIYYVLCFIGYGILYIFQIIPIPFYIFANHLVYNFKRRLDDITFSMNSLLQLILTYDKQKSGKLIEEYGSHYRLKILQMELKYYSKVFKVLFTLTIDAL
jgi:CBS domain containing-hemolysin-like protein